MGNVLWGDRKDTSCGVKAESLKTGKAALCLIW